MQLRFFSTVWVMLIEKAYAKLHGSYTDIDGGWMENGMVDLTGGVGGRVVIQVRFAYCRVFEILVK